MKPLLDKVLEDERKPIPALSFQAALQSLTNRFDEFKVIPDDHLCQKGCKISLRCLCSENLIDPVDCLSDIASFLTNDSEKDTQSLILETIYYVIQITNESNKSRQVTLEKLLAKMMISSIATNSEVCEGIAYLFERLIHDKSSEIGCLIALAELDRFLGCIPNPEEDEDIQNKSDQLSTYFTPSAIDFIDQYQLLNLKDFQTLWNGIKPLEILVPILPLIRIISKHLDIYCNGILTYIKYVMSEKKSNTINWEIGMDIIHVLENVLDREVDSWDGKKKVRGILQNILNKKYGISPDVQDSSMILKRAVDTLSHEKLKCILQSDNFVTITMEQIPTRENVASPRKEGGEKLSPFLPRSLDDLNVGERLDKVFGLQPSIESQGLQYTSPIRGDVRTPRSARDLPGVASVGRFSPHFTFQLVEAIDLQQPPQLKLKTLPNQGNSSEEVSKQDKKSFELFYKWKFALSQVDSFQVLTNWRLTLIQDQEEFQIQSQEVRECDLFAIWIEFQQMDQKDDTKLSDNDFRRKRGSLKMVKPIQITFVDLQELSKQEKQGVMVQLSMKPLLPLPLLLRPYMECSDGEGFHHGFSLPYIQVQLYHFFSSVPIEALDGVEINDLFEVMWEVLNSKCRQKGIDKIVSESRDVLGSIVPKVLTCKVDQISACLQKFIPQCCLQKDQFSKDIGENISVYDDVLRVFIFLPPQYHILIKLDSLRNESGSKLLVATDFWPCLPALDSYIDKILYEYFEY
eukprot:TRINITY_DN86000_c0_g1_i6.p1 TRINITY_DN86000_c0_g1~~TRINITY_DN86000_c0_g1_i6.p1  ORF type:complete len:847 (-),score=139.37 TRINITY_DN86000_c0_g1_i6:147-2378(-)